MWFRHSLSETSPSRNFLLFFTWEGRTGLIYWFEDESYQKSALCKDHLMVSIRKLNFFWVFAISTDILHFDPGYFFLCVNTVLIGPQLIFSSLLIPMWYYFYFLFFLQVAIWANWLWSVPNAFIYLLILSYHSGSTASGWCPAEMAFQAAYED